MISYLIAHILADFYLQSKELALYKKHRMDGVVIHCTIYAVVFISLLIMRLLLHTVPSTEIVFTLIIVVTHTVIDFSKYYLIDSKTYMNSESVNEARITLSHSLLLLPFREFLQEIPEQEEKTVIRNFALSNSVWTFMIDQILHFGLIIWLGQTFVVGEYLPALSMVLVLLFLGKPSNILISRLIKAFDPKSLGLNEGFVGAGERIGTLERILTFLILYSSSGNIAGVAIVLSLKTVARYKRISENAKFAEYFVIGSLTSLLLTLVVFYAPQYLLFLK